MKNIVITGASDGLGMEMAKILKNNNITLISRNENKLRKLSDELNCNYYVCDLTKYDDLYNIFNDIGNIDVLINNAGVWLAGDIENNSFESISNWIDVNTKAPIYTIKCALPIMKKNKSGLIINVCSQSSFDIDDFSPVYNASKWAMRGLNRSLQKKLSKDGISITGFYPGFMQTNFFNKAGNNYNTSSGLKPEKVAKAVKYIVDLDSEIVITEFGIKDIENY